MLQVLEAGTLGERMSRHAGMPQIQGGGTLPTGMPKRTKTPNADKQSQAVAQPLAVHNEEKMNPTERQRALMGCLISELIREDARGQGRGRSGRKFQPWTRQNYGIWTL